MKTTNDNCTDKLNQFMITNCLHIPITIGAPAALAAVPGTLDTGSLTGFDIVAGA